MGQRCSKCTSSSEGPPQQPLGASVEVVEKQSTARPKANASSGAASAAPSAGAAPPAQQQSTKPEKRQTLLGYSHAEYSRARADILEAENARLRERVLESELPRAKRL